MIARVLRVDVEPRLIDAVLATYHETVRPIHQAANGLRQHYVLVDRHVGRIEIIGIWESAEALADVAPILEPARKRLWAQFSTEPQLAVYDVADELRHWPTSTT